MNYFCHTLCLLLVTQVSWAQLERKHLSEHLLQPEESLQTQDQAHQSTGKIRMDDQVPRSFNFLAPEINIGSTTYDLQTNASIGNRFLVDVSGRKTAIWMQSLAVDEIFDDRGTGINVYDAGWHEMPEDRIEQERTGWPSVVQLADGSHVISSHSVDSEIHFAKRGEGETSWTESKLPSGVSFGLLWPRLAAGGPDGMTLHSIALTAPDDELNPQEYLGVEGHLLYARSLDGGDTWDKVDQVIPGLDSTTYAFLSPDTYSVHARDNVVAVVLYGEWGDLALFKSEDNGETWQRTIINDFPLDRYKIDDGYTFDDIVFDEFAPDSLAVYTTSGEGDAVIDANGMVHITYAESYVLDTDTADDASSYYPAWSGIGYWNESFTEAPLLIGSLLDYDDNDTLDLIASAIPRYANGTATNTPTIGLDDQGGVFVCFAAVSEAHFNEQDEQNYRHLVAVRSRDGGETWGPMIDLINDDLVDPEFNDFIETVYPAAAELVDDTFHIIYQQDFFPGHRFTDEQDPLIDNFIVYLAVPVDLIPDESVLSASDFTHDLGIKVFPTVTEGRVQIQSENIITGDVTMEIYDLLGRRHRSQRQRGLPNSMDLTPLQPGSYLVIVRTAEGNAVYRIIKQ